MGFWDKLNPFETEKVNVIDANKPLTNQLVNNTNSNVVQNTYMPVQQNMNSSFQNPGIQLSEEDKNKWINFLSDIYKNARKANPIFDDFENQLDAINTVLIGAQDAQKIQAVYAIMATKGINKNQLVTAAQEVLKTINDSKNNFDTDLQSRNQKGIVDLQTQIQDKLQAITNLQNEISQLNLTINENQNKIAIRNYGFNSCFNNLIAKANKDINDITNYIIG